MTCPRKFKPGANWSRDGDLAEFHLPVVISRRGQAANVKGTVPPHLPKGGGGNLNQICAKDPRSLASKLEQAPMRMITYEYKVQVAHVKQLIQTSSRYGVRTYVVGRACVYVCVSDHDDGAHATLALDAYPKLP